MAAQDGALPAPEARLTEKRRPCYNRIRLTGKPHTGMERSAFDLIYAAVRRVPFGRVATYGQIARLAGNPRWPRVVGYALHVCRDNSLPCHRIVNREGRLCEGFDAMGSETQRILLAAEGVEFLPDGRVDLSRFLWDGEAAPEEEPKR